MNPRPVSTATVALTGIEPGEAGPEYDRREMQSWSDRELVAAAGAMISRPKVDPANSFVLHAPLELLARAALLDHVEPAAKEHARRRIVWLAATYAAAGASVDEPGPVATGSVDETGAALIAAIAAGDLEAVDGFAAHLGAHASAADLRRLLAGPVAPSLAAAGHASIFFSLLPRVAAAAAVPLTLLRGPAASWLGIRGESVGSTKPLPRRTADRSHRWPTRCSTCRYSAFPAATSSFRS